MQAKTAPTYWAKIYIAGPINIIEQTCRAYALEHGLCVTVTPTKYIYTGGEETGAEIGLINYPRFPTEPETIKQTALHLADLILHDTHQGSYTVMCPDETTFVDRREGFKR